MNSTAKDRSVNFTSEEISLLKTLVDSKKAILLNKKSDAIHVKDKEAAWEIITSKFNASSPNLVMRSKKQLRNKFENMKKSARKELSSHQKKYDEMIEKREERHASKKKTLDTLLPLEEQLLKKRIKNEEESHTKNMKLAEMNLETAEIQRAKMVAEKQLAEMNLETAEIQRAKMVAEKQLAEMNLETAEIQRAKMVAEKQLAEYTLKRAME